MIDIEERSLGAFEENALSPRLQVVHELLRIDDETGETIPHVREIARNLLGREGRCGENGEELVRVVHLRLDDIEEIRLVMEKRPHAKPSPQVFVGVRGTDPLPGAPDALLLEIGLQEVVEHSMVRHHDLGGGADMDAPVHVDAPRYEILELGEKRLGIDDHSVSENRRDVRIENARGNLMEREPCPRP